MDEQRLVRLSREGDKQAFSSLVSVYQAKMFGLAFGLTRDREAADDLAQEVFIKAYQSLPKFRGEAGFGTWLYRLAVNHVKDYLRKMKSRWREVSLDDNKAMTLPAGRDEAVLREDEALVERRRALVHQTVRTLSPKYQVILNLRDIQGLSYEEIAAILKLSPGTVDSRLHRARKKLRERLEPYFSRGGGHEMQES